MMKIQPKIQKFWTRFLEQTGRSAETRLYEVFSFADSRESANRLAKLVLKGKKVATASLLREYDQPGKRPPLAGDLSIVTDWDGNPLCVIETTKVTVRPFEEVDEAFAAAEGEGDRSLKSWRKAHWEYFDRVCRELGIERSPTMPVVCERFRVIKLRRKRVYAYITHRGRLLVFAHADFPEAGLQVPGGTVQADETTEMAVMREAREETGLRDLRMVSFLGRIEKDMEEYGSAEIQEASFYHLECAGQPAESWQHEERSGGENGPILFDFSWALLNGPSHPDLIALNGAMLDQLTQRMKGLY